MSGASWVRLIQIVLALIVGSGAGVGVQTVMQSQAEVPAVLKATISGDSSVPVGTMGKLTADVQGATTQRWYPVDPRFSHTCPDHTSLTFTGNAPETRTYALFASNGTDTVIETFAVNIVSSGDVPNPPTGDPCPPDTPNPIPPNPVPPTPQPPIPPVPNPPNPAELTQLARQWLATVPARSAGKKPAIASAVDGIIAAINAGRLKTVGEVDQALRAGLIVVVGVDTGWLTFGTSYNAEIERRKSDGRISTAADYAAALSQIVEALR